MLKITSLILVVVIILFFSFTKDDKPISDFKRQLILQTFKGKPLQLTFSTGSKIPKFRNINFDDERLNDKIIFIDFWATWCAPCKETIPFLTKLQKKYPNDLAIIGVILENRSLESVSDFIKQFEVNYIISDAGKEGGDFPIAELLGGVRGLPTLFIYDEKGQYAKHFRGQVAEHYISDTLEKLVAQKLANKAL